MRGQPRQHLVMGVVEAIPASRRDQRDARGEGAQQRFAGRAFRAVMTDHQHRSARQAAARQDRPLGLQTRIAGDQRLESVARQVQRQRLLVLSPAFARHRMQDADRQSTEPEALAGRERDDGYSALGGGGDQRPQLGIVEQILSDQQTARRRGGEQLERAAGMVAVVLGQCQRVQARHAARPKRMDQGACAIPRAIVGGVDQQRLVAGASQHRLPLANVEHLERASRGRRRGGSQRPSHGNECREAER